MRGSIQELRTKSERELRNNLIEQRESLRRARFDLSAGRVKNASSIRQMRRDIARTLSILREKGNSL